MGEDPASCCTLLIDLLNFVFLGDCPSLASQSSNFHITCGTFPAFLCFPASFEIRNANSTYRYYCTRFVYTIRYYTLLDHMHAQLRLVRLYIAQQRSVAQRSALRSRALRCRVLRCGAVSLRCAFFRKKAVPGIMHIVYGVLLFPFFFLFLHVFDLSRPPVFSPTQITPILPIRHRGNKSTQHS